MRSPRVLLAVAVVIAAVGVGAAVVHRDDDGVPRSPAQCAGPSAADQAMAKLRQDQWRATVDLVDDDPTLAVWVGFGRVLSSKQVADTFGSTRIEGVVLAWQQRQGTTVHAQDRFRSVRADDPSVRTAAVGILHRSSTPFPVVGSGPNDPMAAVDPGVLAGEPPIVAVLVTSDLEHVVRAHRCLIYSLLPGTSGEFPALPTAIGG